MAQSGRFTANGDVNVSLPVDPHRATPPVLYARGNPWGSGTITVTVSPDGGTSYALSPAVTIAADGYKVLPLMGGIFKLSLAGATGPVIDWWIQ